MSLHDQIEQDVVTWIDTFIATPNAFYDGKFAPCPYARGAITAGTVDVAAWRAGDPRLFIKEQAFNMRDMGKIQTRVLIFPPRVQSSLGISEYVDTLNMELISDNIFLNTGVAKSTKSLYSGSGDKPYFMVVVNTLSEVLRGAKSLQKTKFYANWPAPHYQLVVERRASMAERYGTS